MLNEIYGQFTKKAAEGRKMDVDKLERLARGRIYIGRRALELGLIDQVGTLDDSIQLAKQLAGLKPEDKLERLSLPKTSSPFESLLGLEIETSLRAAYRNELKSLLPPEMTDLIQDTAFLRRLAADPAAAWLPCRIEIK
jgi:protease-4